MAERGAPSETLSLLDWQPPRPNVGFDPDQVRGSSVAATFSRAIAAALKDCGKDRKTIAAEMSDYLRERVTANMLDAYASQAREDHKISLPRFAALIHATGDMRLLGVLVEMFGHVVIPQRYLGAINEVLLTDKIAELQAQLEDTRGRWRSSS